MLRGVNIARPGSFGLSTQQDIAEEDEQQRFASVATNGIIDNSGKLVSRQDFVLQTAGFAGTPKQIYTHRNADGTDTILSSAGGVIYSGIATLTSRYDYSGTITTDNFQFASLTGKIFFAQAGAGPKVLNETDFVEESFTGAPWTNSPNVLLAGDGRLWAADDAAGSNRYTVWWSNLLDGKVWNAGDAGSINVRKAFPKGHDSIMAIAILSGRLVIFGRHSILLYTQAATHDPDSMELTDVVENVGCMARDSVLVAGGDLYFLYDDGVYRIPRLAQITSLISLDKVSKNVADDLVTDYASETLTQVRAGFYPKEGIYVLNAPTANKCWVFHTKRPVPTGEDSVVVPAVTSWTNVGVPFYGFTYDKDGNWYTAMRTGIGKYTGYTPDGASNAYNFEVFSQWTAWGDETRLKHLKSYAMTLEAASGQTGTFKWLTDYVQGTTNAISFTCDSTEFAEDPGIGTVKGAIGRSCNVTKFGFTMAVDGDKIGAHALRVYAQPGKTKVK